jgi:hypothetical protein
VAFLKALTEAETASFTDARGRAPADTAEVLTDEEIDGALQHPAARGPLADVMRIIGDQLHKVFEPGLEGLGIGKGDRLKADHPQYKLAKSLCAVFKVEKLDVYQAKVGAHIAVENTDPLSMVVGVDVVRRYQAREQRFLFARAAYLLRNKMPIAHKLDTQRLGDLLGNAVRVVAPSFNRLGKPDPDMTKRLKKAMSGKAIKALEGVVGELERAKTLDVGVWLQASSWSADRAGLLLSGDIAAALRCGSRRTCPPPTSAWTPPSSCSRRAPAPGPVRAAGVRHQRRLLQAADPAAALAVAAGPRALQTGLSTGRFPSLGSRRWLLSTPRLRVALATGGLGRLLGQDVRA